MTKKVNIDIVAKDKTQQAVSSSKRSLGGLKKFALAASAALATIGAAKVITGLIRTGVQVENLKVQLKALTGSAEAGQQALDTVFKFAKDTPFELSNIQNGIVSLLTVKNAADKAGISFEELLTITGNTAVLIGGDFTLASQQIQRALSAGIASADLFRDRGVSAMAGFKSGVRVNAEDTAKILNKAFGEGGEFGGLMKDLSTTVSGSVSNIKDSFFQLQVAITEGFFDELQSELGNVKNSLAENEQEIKEFGTVIGENLGSAILTLASAMKRLQDSFAEFEVALGALLLASRGFFKVIAGGALVIDSLNRKNKELIENTVEYNRVLSSIGYDDAIMRIQRMTEAQTLLNEVLTEDSTPALSQIEQDLLDLQLALEPLGDAFEKAFAPLDEALAKSDQDKIKQAEETARKNLEAFKKGKFGEIEAQKVTDKELGKMARHTLQEGAKINKELFRLNQALNIGEAIMNTAKGITAALGTGNIPLAIAVGAMGAVQVATIASQQPPAQFGGSRLPNSPFLVGEKGPELFTPNTAGSVTPNHQLGGGGATVNFNITTVDASSFGALLDTRRGQIVNMINSALNNKGQAALV